jgi:hypothetical protein
VVVVGRWSMVGDGGVASGETDRAVAVGKQRLPGRLLLLQSDYLLADG